ncbi:hypothetical protein C1645_840904 [Glomus cerebriforme]|uniref:DNA topoisomerase (ATP-hydrolyzing) n=1 Tax=Glomus cerebriforme TaxID=658196 RepID=A0A397S5T5_9GLOM|nr:hypothetical protein C1645_840904 [Glomus cerebriforme]
MSFIHGEGQFEVAYLVEPEWYLPILSIVLVNGSKGIGAGKYCMKKYKVNGKICQVDESVRITELSIRVWTQNYKE